MAAGHNGVVTGGRLLARAALVGALVLGVVGMHHLVIAACHHLGVSSTSSAMVMDHHAGHSVPTEVPAAPAPADPAPAGALGAAAMCLAVLLLVVLILAPRAWAHLRRSESRPAFVHIQALLREIARPPDLLVLSISRT